MRPTFIVAEHTELLREPLVRDIWNMLDQAYGKNEILKTWDFPRFQPNAQKILSWENPTQMLYLNLIPTILQKI